MDREKNRRFQLLIVGIPFQNLFFAFVAAEIEHLQLLKIQFPFSIQFVRIGCLLIAFLSISSIPFTNRHIRSKDADRMRSNHIDPELILLLINLLMLLLPVMCVLLLTFLGLPVIDIYFYSYLSFALMLGLLVTKRKILWSADLIETNIESESGSLPVTKSYTVVLALLTLIALLLFLAKIVIMINPPREHAEPIVVLLPLTVIYALVFTGCTLAVILRLRHSRQAIAFTALISPLLAFWVPFGTAGYFYWRFKVKPRELSIAK